MSGEFSFAYLQHVMSSQPGSPLSPLALPQTQEASLLFSQDTVWVLGRKSQLWFLGGQVSLGLGHLGSVSCIQLPLLMARCLSRQMRVLFHPLVSLAQGDSAGTGMTAYSGGGQTSAAL
jgi:hypothetical protein